MNKKNITVMILLLITIKVNAENIDPYNDDSQYAYGENIGWLNFDPNTATGAQVTSDKVTGFVWAENIGWINLNCENNGTWGTVSFGIVNDSKGNLSGYAWAENVGWISFDPNVPGDTTNEYKVTIDAGGKLSGWAWGENIGWIHFDETQNWDVRVCIVTLEDLRNFALYWLGTGSLADLYPDGIVNFPDFSIFASYWQDFCPDGWELK